MCKQVNTSVNISNPVASTCAPNSWDCDCEIKAAQRTWNGGITLYNDANGPVLFGDNPETWATHEIWKALKTLRNIDADLSNSIENHARAIIDKSVVEPSVEETYGL